MDAIRESGGDVLVDVRLTPRASRDRIGEIHDGRYKISVTSPPVDHEANAHLIQFIAKVVGVPRSAITIEHGETSRNKTIRICGIGADDVSKRLTHS